MKPTFRVFTRTFWKRDKAGALRPHAGRETTLARYETAAEARDHCATWNKLNPPGALGRRAEYRES